MRRQSSKRPGSLPRFATEAEELELLDEAMAEVRPLKSGPRRVGPPRRPARQSPAVRAEPPAPASELALPSVSERIEGGRESPKVMARLRRGGFALQGRLDLHGMTREEARTALVRFLGGSADRGLTCVLVIHGWGLHSPEGRPVLKRELQEWFRSPPFSRWVAAYCTAAPQEGGSGATYVLLRGWRKSASSGEHQQQ